jgi:hypothetical protein
MIITTVWGHPTPETIHYIPKNAIVSTGKGIGHYLKSLCEKDPVKISLFTETWTGFKKAPLAIADLRGRVEPDNFVLFTGQVDSWHKGASDNATANACILEVARIAVKHRNELHRGVRCIWWSGHSHGRYSGSTWYADNHWEDLYDHAIVHLNVDSLGCHGATDYSKVECSAELYDLEKGVIKDYADQIPPYHRIPRTGDSSFWGIGIPSLFGLLSLQPPERSTNVMFPGLAWFWHTEADTLDKIDRNILLKDTRIYMAALWRLCATPVLPFRFVMVADEIILHISGLKEKARDAFDMSPLLEKIHLFRSKADKLDRICEEITSKLETLNKSIDDQKVDEIVGILNLCIMGLNRILIPLTYCEADRFDMDRTFHIPFMPRFQRVAQMGSMDRHTDFFKFLERRMVREQYRICHCINKAITLIDETLQKAVAL